LQVTPLDFFGYPPGVFFSASRDCSRWEGPRRFPRPATSILGEQPEQFYVRRSRRFLGQPA